MKTPPLTTAAVALLLMPPAVGQVAVAQDKVPLFTAIPTVLVRSPNPEKLAQFYIALGFKPVGPAAPTGTTGFKLEGSVGSLEILRMAKDAQPSGRKTSRTQQGVVAIFETTDQEALIARAKSAGATLIEKLVPSEVAAEKNPIAIYYIADPENNILGFAPRHHNSNLKTP